jgi:hypothetical protein
MDFWANFWPNFASDLAAGVVIGGLVALWINNRQNKAEERERKRKILRLLKKKNLKQMILFYVNPFLYQHMIP